MKKLTKAFYHRPTLEVSKDLLGKFLVHQIGVDRYVGKIVEVEAYIGEIDKACHAYNNKVTNRTKVLYDPPGTAYVYLIYGMYYCFNVVTEEAGKAAAVLIRAVEPIEGLEKMVENRYKKKINEITKKQLINLTNGPGKLCMAMNITKNNNGMDLFNDELYIIEDKETSSFDTMTTTRINIDYAEEAIDFPWRFYIKDSSYVSKK
ncbi:DNA-3-methyladenine glycosylase [Clostridium formicaceticum]|uniref:Putative 3-methyladenine DNA glycosylase n=1 Tax=Clostridium formicaceticum TaxID=1497 RepID=A0AAC9RJD0_9CLOT|nr:DNA-3-methyladenine glycosylase [Clostridium formicaceticum]AOY76292.1 3-methyladenine DNA glycosylase [Clostridium formicaceticum]ARE86679.1 3-methyladenine DNA glycosylase [Clostridium formicaceticum]